VAIKNLIKQLEVHKKQLEACDYIHNKEAFFQYMQEFWEYISNFKDKHIYELFEHTEYYSKNYELFASFENYYVRTLEALESMSILTKNVHTDASFLDFFNKRIAKETYLQTSKEIQMADFSNCKTLVMVGAGPLPETILYIYENTDIENIIGLDNNQEAVFMAGEMVRSQNLPRIKFLHYDGTLYDYNDADIIYVANFVRPKKKIFHRIAETAKTNVQIVTRTPVMFGRMLYEDTLPSLHPRLSLIQEGEINWFFLWKPLLIKKLDI
jgi:hypothetical protein